MSRKRRKRGARPAQARPDRPAAVPASGSGGSSRRNLALVVIAAAVLVALLTAWWLAGRPSEKEARASASPEAPPPPPLPTEPIRSERRPVPDTEIGREFLEIADRLGRHSEYLGTDRIAALREEAGGEGSRPVDLEASVLLAQALAQHGLLDEAQAIVDELLPAHRGSPGLLRLAAIVHLRRAEAENCIRRHDRDCCLLPLQGGGVHEERRPAEAAREAYLQYLLVSPSDLRARWLLNVTAMALGEYPEAVPILHRIPESAFRSKKDIGRFVDVAPQLGVDDLNLCGGVVADDLDGDGLLDIVSSSYEPGTSLVFHRNRGDGGFEDATERSGLLDQLGGLNVLGADYDSDGDVDLLVLRGAWLFEDGRIRNSLLRNEGDGRWVDVTREAGLAEPAEPTQAATWGDFDNDGDLDLFVGVESFIEQHRAGISRSREGDYRAHLYLNQGDGTFRDAAAEAGLDADCYTKGVAAGDYDNDGDLDLYVSAIGPNRLYRNEGDGTFTNVASELGVEEPNGRSFAAWFFDQDNDGWLDLFVGAYSATLGDIAADHLGLPHGAEPARLYRNEGGTFRDVSREVGLDRPFLPMGANFGDFDNDGWLDIYLATGDPNLETIVPNAALWNDGGERFVDVSFSAGLGHLQKGHGVAFADFDHDGDQDLFNQLGGFYAGDAFHNALFRNPGHGRHWLHLRLVGTRSVRNGYGARVKLVVDGPDGEREIHRAVGSVSSFGGSPARQEIGLGSATSITRLEVRWPASGIVQRFEGLPVDRLVTVTEGEDRPQVVELEAFPLGEGP